MNKNTYTVNKNDYLQLINLNVYKMYGSSLDDDYVKYCDPKRLQHCISKMNSMFSLLESFDDYRTNLQALWFRDTYGIGNFVKDILIGQFGFNVEYREINMVHEHTLCDTINDTTELINKLLNFIKSLKNNKIYFAAVYIQNHINIHYVDTHTKNVYSPSHKKRKTN